MASMTLKRFTCKHPCKSENKCAKLPLELHRDKNGSVDILFLTEYPGKNEITSKQFLSTESRHGSVFRNIISFLEKKMGTDWSYAICGLFKAPVSENIIKGNGKNIKDKKVLLNLKDLQHCSRQVTLKEIEYCDPKLIVALGEYSFNFIFEHEPKYGLLVENNKFYHNVQIGGEKRSVLCLMHPSWGVRSGGDGCTIGYLFEGIRRAIDFIHTGIDYHIPDTFKTELLTNYEDVKNVLLKMRKTPSIVAVDTEDNNLNKVYDNYILSLQLCNNGKTGYVIPIDHYESPFKGNKKLKKLLYSFFTKPNTQTTGYLFVNCKFDYHQLFREFNTFEMNAPLLDCSFAEYTLDENWTRIHGFPNQKGHFSLFTLAYKRNFNYYVKSDMKETRAILSHLPLDKWAKYGGADVVAPWQIFKTQLLQAERSNYLDGFKSMNYIFFQHLVRSCMYCEHTGLSINFPQLQHLYSQSGVFSQAIKEVLDEFYKLDNVKKTNDILLKEKTGTTGSGLFGETRLFNPSKNLQRDILYFKVMGLEPVDEDDEDDKEGGSTGKQFQKQYRDAYPEVALLEQFNSLNKMKTGFVNPVYDWMNPKSPNKLADFQDFRARSNFSYLTVTGRLRSYNPNCVDISNSYIYIDDEKILFADLIKRDNLKHNQNVDYQVRSITGNRRAYRFYLYEHQDVLCFKCETGHTISCTFNDKRLVFRDNKYTRIDADQVKIGDYFICDTQKSMVTSISLKKDVTVADFSIEDDNTQPYPFNYGSIIINDIWGFNSQQRPSHSKYTKDILTMYTPPKGRCIIKLDYVTFEVKGLGFISGDKAMVKSFNEMHELKNQYRKDPTCFFEQGYEIEKKSFDAQKKELKERKEKLKVLKEVSVKEYKIAKEKLYKDIQDYKEKFEKFKKVCNERPQEISHNYLVFQTDFHRRSASLFNSVPIEKVTKEMRQNAKGIVFGCFEGNTVISTKNCLFRMTELENKKCKVQSINRKIVSSDGVIYKGEKPVVRVLTRQAALIGTSGHPVLTVNSDGKLELKHQGKLQKGDLVVYQKGVFGNIVPKLGKKEISVEDAEAMGLFTGDGSASRSGNGYRFSYKSVDKTEITRFRDFIYRWSGIKGEIKLEHNDGSFAKEAGDDDRWIYHTGVTSINTWVLLNNFGLLGTQNIRRVPPQILRAKPEYVAAYLRGYFDADGGIRKSSRGYRQLFLSSMNCELLTDVIMLLALFNITAHLYKGSHNRKTGEFEIIITSSTSIIKFYENIGFGTENKQKKLAKYVKRIKKTIYRKIPIDKIQYPMSKQTLLSKYAMQAGVNTFRSRPVYKNGVRILPLKHELQDTISNIDEYKESFYALDMKDEWKCLKLLSNPDIRLSPVFEEAVDYGIAPVYDCVNVEKYNKWVANGVVVSNSIYGRGIPSIAKELKIPEEDAQKYFNLFMENMPQAAKWLKDQPVFGKENLYVDSPVGRRRRLWGYLMGQKSFDAKMDRYADNSVIQGSCSDFQLLGTSMVITLMHKVQKAIGQCDYENSWLATNMIHDSCEFEVPIQDAYYVILTFEALYTNLLEKYIHKAFGFKIKVPLEIDMTVGSSYANTKDWDGSKQNAKEIMKWLCEECSKRDNTDYSHLYKKALKHPFFTEYPDIAEQVCDEWIEKSKI